MRFVYLSSILTFLDLSLTAQTTPSRLFYLGCFIVPNFFLLAILFLFTVCSAINRRFN